MTLERTMDAECQKSVECNTCGECFENKYSLLQHKSKHSKFSYIKSVRKKYLSHFRYRLRWKKFHVCNFYRKSFNCLMCSKAFIRKRAIEKHMKMCHPNNELKCLFCDHWCNSYPELIVHSQKHTHEQPYKCSHCGQGFVSLTELTQHEEAHVVKEFNCIICGKQFTKNKYLHNHLKIHDKGYECLHCRKKFTNTKKFSIHRSSNERCNALPCKLCGLLFMYKCQLVKHMYDHNSAEFRGDTSLNCLCCQKKFSSPAGLTRHRRQNEVGALPCKLCGLQFMYKCQLLKHIEESYYLQCQMCQKIFTTIQALIKHRISNKESPSPCSFCEKQFDYKCLLMKHFKEHLQEISNGNSQQCLMCHKKFIFKRPFVNHLMLNEGKVPPCKVCKMQYAYKCQLEEHLIYHERATFQKSEVLYDCRQCKRQFSTKESLSEHYVMHHKDSFRIVVSPNNTNFEVSKSSKFIFSLKKQSPTTDYQGTLSLQSAGIDLSKKFKCHECSEMFIYKTTLCYHTKKFHGQRVSAAVNNKCDLLSGKKCNEDVRDGVTNSGYVPNDELLSEVGKSNFVAPIEMGISSQILKDKVISFETAKNIARSSETPKDIAISREAPKDNVNSGEAPKGIASSREVLKDVTSSSVNFDDIARSSDILQYSVSEAVSELGMKCKDSNCSVEDHFGNKDLQNLEPSCKQKLDYQMSDEFYDSDKLITSDEEFEPLIYFQKGEAKVESYSKESSIIDDQSDENPETSDCVTSNIVKSNLVNYELKDVEDIKTVLTNKHGAKSVSLNMDDKLERLGQVECKGKATLDSKVKRNTVSCVERTPKVSSCLRKVIEEPSIALMRERAKVNLNFMDAAKAVAAHKESTRVDDNLKDSFKVVVTEERTIGSTFPHNTSGVAAHSKQLKVFVRKQGNYIPISKLTNQQQSLNINATTEKHTICVRSDPAARILVKQIKVGDFSEKSNNAIASKEANNVPTFCKKTVIREDRVPSTIELMAQIPHTKVKDQVVTYPAKPHVYSMPKYGTQDAITFFFKDQHT